MPNLLKDFKAALVQFFKVFMARERYGNHLTGECAGIFQPGITDIPFPDPQSAGKPVEQFARADSRFFDPQEEVLSRSAAGVEGDLFNLKIFRGFLVSPTGSRQVGGEEIHSVSSGQRILNPLLRLGRIGGSPVFLRYRHR